MTLADISIRNHVFAWMLMFGPHRLRPHLLHRASAASCKGLGVSQNPDVDFPIVNVSVDLRGRLARDHGDGRRRPHRGRDHLRRGRQADLLHLAPGLGQHHGRVRALAATSTPPCRTCRRGWPRPRAGCRARSTRRSSARTTPRTSPIMWLSLSGNRSPTFMADYVRNVLRPAVPDDRGRGRGLHRRLPRAQRSASGSTPPRLEAQGLTVQDVIRAIEREHLEVPAGRIETPSAR